MISKNQSSNPDELKYFENEINNQKNINKNIQKENNELCKCLLVIEKYIR